jgi:hypothetical protein
MDNGNEPATKQDVAEVRTEMRGDRLIKAVRDSRTELLKAFYSFAESNHCRLVQLEGNQGALIARIGTLEDRMTDLERKVTFPNHPTQ